MIVMEIGIESTEGRICLGAGILDGKLYKNEETKMENVELRSAMAHYDLIRRSKNSAIKMEGNNTSILQKKRKKLSKQLMFVGISFALIYFISYVIYKTQLRTEESLYVPKIVIKGMLSSAIILYMIIPEGIIINLEFCIRFTASVITYFDKT